MVRSSVLLVSLFGVFLTSALRAAEPTEPKGPEITPAAAELLGRMNKEYKGLSAYSADGEIVLTHSVGSTTIRVSRRMPLRFVRPNLLTLDLGPLVLVA